MEKFVITRDLVNKVVSTVDKGLVKGVGVPKPGQMCVEAAVCYAMGLPHGDNPTCVNPVIRGLKISLNDSKWSSNKARADGLRRLAVLQLGTKEMSPAFDQIEFTKRLALQTIKQILPIALLACNLPSHAEACKNVTTLEEGRAAAYAAAYSAAYAAAYAAAYSARSAAYAADAADAAYAVYAARSTADAADAYAARSTADAAAYSAAYAADAYAADAYAARSTADAADAAAYAADAAAYAADAADAAARDKTLKAFATIAEDILIDMGVPAVSFLDFV